MLNRSQWPVVVGLAVAVLVGAIVLTEIMTADLAVQGDLGGPHISPVAWPLLAVVLLLLSGVTISALNSGGPR